jgi:hypothetical protein
VAAVEETTMNHRFHFAFVLAGLAASAVALPALAHTRVKDPPPIGGADDLKLGPCGCSFAPGSTNPCPTTYPVTTLEAGSLVNVTWTETVNHDGMFRVAFSTKTPEAVTESDLDAGMVWEGTDTNMTAPADISEVVTVPNTPCDKCTLQVRQFMEGSVNPYYFSCAAVKIVPAGSGTGGSGPGAATSVGAGPGATSGVGSTGSGSGPPQYVPQPNEDGCSMTSGDPIDALSWLPAVAALAAVRARKRRG